MTLSHILSADYLPAARIGGGGFSLAPAVTSFADDRASVAPTVSGCITAGFAQGSQCFACPTAGGFGSRHFSQFGAVAGSSSQRADETHGASLFVGDGLTGASMVPTPQTPGALTECATSVTSAGGHLA